MEALAEPVTQQPSMDVDPEQTAKIFSALSTERRILTLKGLVEGRSPVEISDDLDVTRPTLQPYLEDFRELGWIKKTGRSFSVTAQGNHVWDMVSRLATGQREFEEVQKFLRENPSVVPEEVLNEIRENR